MKIKFFLAYIFLLSSAALRAGNEQYTVRLDKAAASQPERIEMGNSMSLKDPLFTTITGVTYSSKVSLIYNRKNLSDYKTGLGDIWEYEVPYTLSFYNSTNVLITTFRDTLTINYNLNSTSSNPVYEAVKNYNYFSPIMASFNTNQPKVILTVGDPVATGTVPSDIHLELTLIKEKLVTASPGASSLGYDAVNKRVYWSFLTAAESYELEWTHIDQYDNFTYVKPQDPFIFKEPVRIITSNQHFDFNNTYPKGTIYFRVRGVGRFVASTTGGPTPPRYGTWSYGSSSVIAMILNAVEFQPSKTWQFVSTFAEEGKYKKVMSYYDGSLRERQSLVNISTDNSVIASERKYDHEGRAVVNIIPAPLNISSLDYQSNLNQFTTGKAAFDNKTASAPLDTNSGTARYYSSLNDFTNSIHRDYIPSAQGYAYTQVMHTRDNTGRVMKEAGVGETFRLHTPTVSEDIHYTRYFYGTPNETELRRMFGKNVGDAVHYKKNIVVDPNGQISTSYLDQEGRVIATSLAGSSPENLIALPNIPAPVQFPVSLNKNNQVDRANYLSRSVSKIQNVIVDPPQTYSFKYDLNGVYNQASATYGSICKACTYELNIKIIAPDGEVIKDITESLNPAGTCSSGNYQVSSSHNNLESIEKYEGLENIPFSQIGEYTVIKELRLSSGSIDAIIEDLKDPGVNTGFPSLEELITEYTNAIDFSSCNYTCEDHCLTYVQTLEGYGSFTQQQIDDAVAACVKENCGAVINDHITKVADNDCVSLKQQMLDQVSPNGYYNQLSGWLQARIDDAGFVFHDAGNGIMNPKPQVSTLQNPDLFEPQWAEDLFLAHPERCHYLNCELDKASANYDRKMGLIKDWNQAMSSGYINPLAMSIVEGFQDSIANHVSYTGAMQDPFFATGGRGNVQRSNLLTLLKQYKNETTDSKDYNNDGDNADGWVSLWVYSNYKGLYDNKYPDAARRWNTFKGLYLGEKQKKNIFITDGPCDYQDPDKDFTVVKKTELPSASNEINGRNVNNMEKLCIESCEENVKIWMNTLKSKCNIATWGNSDSSNIANHLKTYCAGSCGFKNPFALLIKEDISTNSNLVSANSILSGYGCNLNSIGIDNPCLSTKIESVSSTWVTDTTKIFVELMNEILVKLVSQCGTPNSNCLSPSVPATSIIYYPSQLSTYLKNEGVFDRHPSLGPQELYLISVECFNGGISLYFWFTGMTSGYIFTMELLHENGILDYSKIKRIKNVRPNSIYPIYDLELFDESIVQYPTIEFPHDFDIVGPNYLPVRSQTKNITTCDSMDNNLFSVTPNYTAIRDSCMAELTREAIYNATVVWKEEVNKYLSTYLEEHFNKCFDDPFDEDFYYISNEPYQYHYTLYYYDQAGNLVQTVPPAGVELLATSSFDAKGKYNGTSQSHRLKTRYKYNSLNQLIWQTSPDGGNSNFYYNEKGQMRLSQNAKQKANSSGLNQKYSYTRYDQQGRVVEVGQLENFALDFGLGLIGVDSVAMYDPANATVLNALLNDLSFPLASSCSLTQISKTIYDEVYSGLGVTQQNLRGRVSASVYMPTETYTESITGYSYDIHGNVHKLYQNVYGLPTKTVDYEYDLISGNVNKVFYQKGQSDQFSHAYTYDADNRIRSVKTSSDGIIWEEDAHYFYYKHGPLARTELGEDKLQGTDYVYTLQGWLKNINTPHAQTTSTGIHLNNLDPSKDGLNTLNNINQFVGQDDYMMSLAYYQGDYKAIGIAELGSGNNGIWAAEPGNLMVLGPQNKKGLFNGNISMMVNDTRNFMDVPFPGTGTSDRLMAYRYDQLNRIKNGYSFNSFSSGSGWASRSLGPLVRYDTEFEYDPNGNISKLVRIGNNDALMDNLNYRYNKDVNDKLINNKLRGVTENAPVSGYSDDMEHHSNLDNYQYDAIGNLTGDIKENITDIKWNVYGKVEEVIRSGTNPDLLFSYDAQGNRVIKKIRSKNPDGSPSYFTYIYYVRDASGNVMATYEEDHEVETLKLKEFTVYGSDRLGIKKVDKLLRDDQVDVVAFSTVKDSRVKDAYVDSGSPSVCHGASTLLSAGSGTSVRRLLVDFPERQGIPKGSIILTAYLYLQGNTSTPHDQTGGPNLCYARRITSSWTESGVTWNNQPTAASAFQVSVPALSGTQMASINITGLMQLMINDPDNSHGIELLLQSESGTKAMNFSSSEAASQLHRPRMIVYYREPSRALRTLGKKNYELKDHLGNVRVIISDVKTGHDIAGVDNKADIYTTRVEGFHDYGPFGELLPGRQSTILGDDYKYGFNGKEKNEEWNSGGAMYDYGFRIYDPRIAKFLSVDPLTSSYPWYTPYQFAGNKPIWCIDIDGLEEGFATFKYNPKTGEYIKVLTPNTEELTEEDYGWMQYEYMDGVITKSKTETDPADLHTMEVWRSLRQKLQESEGTVKGEQGTFRAPETILKVVDASEARDLSKVRKMRFQPLFKGGQNASTAAKKQEAESPVVVTDSYFKFFKKNLNKNGSTQVWASNEKTKQAIIKQLVKNKIDLSKIEWMPKAFDNGYQDTNEIQIRNTDQE